MIHLNNKCEICGGPKGRHFNHDACSKIKQEQHKKDPHYPAKEHLPIGAQRAIIKGVGE